MSNDNRPFSLCITVDYSGGIPTVRRAPTDDYVTAQRKEAAKNNLLFCVCARETTEAQTAALIRVVWEAACKLTGRKDISILSRALQKFAIAHGLLPRHPVHEMGYGELVPFPY